jgi:hypothetical protein
VNSRHLIERVILGLVGAVLLHAGAVLAAAGQAPDPVQDPVGVVFNATMETYTVERVPTRSLDAVLKSFESWRHQVLADGSTAEYAAEDGILSMECSACGQSRPSAIEIGKIDLKTVMAYHAGTWNIGIRSSDGAQDFRGLLRGELGSGPHEPARVGDNKRLALTALQDVYDLGYLTQNPQLAATLREGGAPTAGAKALAPKPSQATQSTPAVAGRQTTLLAGATPSGAKPGAISLAALASTGDVERILAQQRAKPGSRDIASALETAYAARARLQLLAGEVDAALQTLTAARQKFGKSAGLRDLEAHYVVIGDAYDRLRLGVKLDVPGVQRYLEQIHTLEPGDATSIELMLAQTLSHRIADQHAAGRDTIAGELLTSGRNLFPDFADLLTRGKAGALPASGIELGTTTAGEKEGR